VVPWLLGAEALLVVAAPLAVAMLWLGAQLVGAGARLRMLELAAQGAVHLAGPLLVLALALAALGTRRPGRRGSPDRLVAWAGLGLGAQPFVAAHALVPLLRPYPLLARVPVGRPVLLGLVCATTALLVVVLLRPPPAPGSSWAAAPQACPTPSASPAAARRLAAPRWLAGPAAVLLVVAVGAAVGLVRTQLPSYPFSALLSPGTGSGSGTPVVAPRIPQNPGTARDPWGSLHDDSWASDSAAVPGPVDPRRSAVESLLTGGDCATLTFDSRGWLVTLCSTLRAVWGYVIEPDTLRVLARARIGQRAASLTDFSGGGYFFLDERDRIVMPARGGVVRVVAVEARGDGAALVASQDLAVGALLQPGEQLTSVMPDWQGRYWFLGDRATAGTIDPGTGRASALTLGAERVANSFAVTPDAAYVVTDRAAYRLAADPSGQPRVVWREPYDPGTRRKPGQVSRGSGTTPTVLAGGTLVAITDNAEPRMNVVVLRTDPDASPRVACRVPVFDPGRSATENSLIGVDRTLVAENNAGYDPPLTATLGGATTHPGLARVDVGIGDGGCTTAWSTGELSIPSVVSKASTADGLIYTYSKPASPWGGDGWYFSAVDLATGRTVWTRLAGGGLAFNNHFAGVAISPTGDLFAGTVSGLVVLRGGGR